MRFAWFLLPFALVANLSYAFNFTPFEAYFLVSRTSIDTDKGSPCIGRMRGKIPALFFLGKLVAEASRHRDKSNRNAWGDLKDPAYAALASFSLSSNPQDDTFDLVSALSELPPYEIHRLGQLAILISRGEEAFSYDQRWNPTTNTMNREAFLYQIALRWGAYALSRPSTTNSAILLYHFTILQTGYSKMRFETSEYLLNAAMEFEGRKARRNILNYARLVAAYATLPQVDIDDMNFVLNMMHDFIRVPFEGARELVLSELKKWRPLLIEWIDPSLHDDSDLAEHLRRHVERSPIRPETLAHTPGRTAQLVLDINRALGLVAQARKKGN